MITYVNQHDFLIKPGRRNSVYQEGDYMNENNIPASLINRPFIIENKI